MTHRCHKGGWICGPECEDRKRLVPAWQRKLMADACETQEVLTSDDLDELERVMYAAQAVIPTPCPAKGDEEE